MKAIVLVFAAMALVGCEEVVPVPESTLANAKNIAADVQFLASNELLGREAGSQEYNKAAAYVAEQYKGIGLTPLGDNGSYMQSIAFRSAKRIPDKGVIVAQSANCETPEFHRSLDFEVFGSTFEEHSVASGPVVFAGYGYVATEHGYDDYEGLDVKGKVVAIISQTAPGFTSAETAVYASERAKAASDCGAVGLLWLPSIESEQAFPFNKMVEGSSLERELMAWIKPNGEVFSEAPELAVSAIFSPAGAQKIFECSEIDFDDVLSTVVDREKPLPTGELGVSLTIHQSSSFEGTHSANVIGLLEGGDPNLKDETVVFLAHLDGIGGNEGADLDEINNGAIDNAAGVAVMLEAARVLATADNLKRSILFVATTAEEKGKLGAQYFAKYPTVAIKNIVAGLNLDPALITYDFTDVIVYGAGESTISESIEAAALAMNVEVSPATNASGLFTRSDHFRLVEAGVPAVMIATGTANGGQTAWREYMGNHYHKPSDDLSRPLNFAAAARNAELHARVATNLANSDSRPSWNKDDFIGQRYGVE